MAEHEHIHDSDTAVSVRPFTPADSPAVDRLIQEGLLPGHVNYESRDAAQIRESFGSEREQFLVAQADGQIIGTLAIVEASPNVGQLHWLRVAPQWQADLSVARSLVRAATEHARAVGLLKLMMHAPPDAEEQITSYYRRLGFELSRARSINGVNVLEFYLNLYEKPQPPETA